MRWTVFMLGIALTLACMLMGCGGASFGAGSGKAKGKEPEKVKEPEAKAPEPDVASEPPTSDSQLEVDTTAPLEPASVVDEASHREHCWFAVSGGFAGAPGYKGVFGSTSSGKPIAPGELFDTVGGIYLAARAAPYVHMQGKKELDRAIEMTFDSLVVPPGMEVEIKDAAGKLLFKTQGPFYGISSFYAQHVGMVYGVLAKNDQIPAWLKEHVKSLEKDKKVPAVPSLQQGRSVLVKEVPGSSCHKHAPLPPT